MFKKQEDGLKVYTNEMLSFLLWHTIHSEKINILDEPLGEPLDPNVIQVIGWKARLDGMAQALGMKKKERQELDAKLELIFKEKNFS